MQVGGLYNCYIRVLVDDEADPSGEYTTVIFGFWWRMQQILVENLITVIFGFWWMMQQILVENLQLLYSGSGGGCNRS